jgi:hypothetical protein
VGIAANLLDNIISSTAVTDTAVIVVVAADTTAVAAIVAAVVVVVVTVAEDTVITVEGNELALEETAKTFGEVALSPGTNDLLTGDVTLVDCEIPLLPDVLNSLVVDDATDVVTLLGDETDTLVLGDEETLLLAAVTLVGEDTLLDVTTDGLLTGLKLLLTDTEVLFVGDEALFVGDEALCVCEATLFTGGDTLHEEVTLLTDEETFTAGDTSVTKSAVASDDTPTLESGAKEVLIGSGLTIESLERATTLPEFALALLDTVRLLGGGVATAAPDILLLLTAPLSDALSLLLLTDVQELLPIKPATAAVSNRCRFFGVAITE